MLQGSGLAQVLSLFTLRALLGAGASARRPARRAWRSAPCALTCAKRPWRSQLSATHPKLTCNCSLPVLIQGDGHSMNCACPA